LLQLAKIRKKSDFGLLAASFFQMVVCKWTFSVLLTQKREGERPFWPPPLVGMMAVPLCGLPCLLLVPDG